MRFPIRCIIKSVGTLEKTLYIATRKYGETCILLYNPFDYSNSILNAEIILIDDNSINHLEVFTYKCAILDNPISYDNNIFIYRGYLYLTYPEYNCSMLRYQYNEKKFIKNNSLMVSVHETDINTIYDEELNLVIHESNFKFRQKYYRSDISYNDDIKHPIISIESYIDKDELINLNCFLARYKKNLLVYDCKSHYIVGRCVETFAEFNDLCDEKFIFKYYNELDFNENLKLGVFGNMYTFIGTANDIRK